MKLPSRNVLAFLASAVLVGLTGWFVQNLRMAQGEDLTKLLGVQQKLNNPAALDVQLVDEQGEKVTPRELMNGQAAIVMLIFYTCKSACVTEFEGALKAFRSMKSQTIGKDYQVITVSIHPKETPELARTKKTEFLERYNRPGAEKGWHFLTGPEDQVQQLAKSIGVTYTYDAAKDRVIHPTGLVFLTPEGRVSKYLLGTEYGQFTDALAAAKANEIGSESIPILFGCFMYDPTTGKTSLNVYTAIRFIGAITLIGLISAIVIMIRRERGYHQTKEASQDPRIW